MLAVATTTAGVLPVWLTGGLSVLMRGDLSFDDRQLGLSVAAFFLASALASAPGGRLAQRLGARRSVAGGVGVTVLTLLAVGTVVDSPLTLGGAMIVAGAANGVVYPAVNLLIAENVTTRRAFAFGIKQAAIPTATLLAGVALPLVSGQLGWRSAFLGAAVAGVGVCAGSWVTLPDGRHGASARPETRHRPTSSLLLLTLASLLGAGAGNAMAAFVVPSAVARGFEPSLAAQVLVFASILCIAVRVVVGWQADRHDTGHLTIVATMLLLGTSALALLAWSAAPFVVLVAAVTIAFAAGWGWAGLMNFIVVEQHPTHAAAATGVLQVGVYTGAVIGPAAFGALVVESSYAVAWTMLALASLTAAGLLRLAGRVRERELQLQVDRRV